MHNSIFYCVANMPGAVPNTSTYALTNATMPYAVALANKGWEQACRDDHSLALGLNTHAGQLTNAPVGEARRHRRGRPGRVLPGRDARSADGTARTALARAVRTYLDHLRGRAGAGGEHADVVPARPAPLPAVPRRAGIDDLDEVTEATVSAFLVRLREGDADHPPLSSTSAARTWSRCGASTSSPSATGSPRPTRRGR